MEDGKKPLPLSEYGTQITGWKQVGANYHGVVSCSTDAPGTDVSTYDFVDSTECDTKDEAMTAARNLHHWLAEKEEQSK
jgi:hypothetical protein